MRKLYAILFITILLSLLCSCENTAINPNATIESPGSSSEISSPNISSSPDMSESPVPVDNEQRKEIFRTFISENYQKLTDACGGISGIGFMDLDLDGGMEMLIFDAGASAAMGVQFFDIIDEKVECVSANMDAVGDLFGDDHLSEVIVNANYFEDFRLMKDKSTGDRFFIVESGNGAADFVYSELIRFGNDNGVLTLESLLYKYEEYDIDSGNIAGESFKIEGKSAESTEYESAYSEFFTAAGDTGFKAAGALLWESYYESSYEGIMSMADYALSLYDQNFNS